MYARPLPSWWHSVRCMVLLLVYHLKTTGYEKEEYILARGHCTKKTRRGEHSKHIVPRDNIKSSAGFEVTFPLPRSHHQMSRSRLSDVIKRIFGINSMQYGKYWIKKLPWRLASRLIKPMAVSCSNWERYLSSGGCVEPTPPWPAKEVSCSKTLHTLAEWIKW